MITLGIIGVVAAISIPNLIANAQKKATAMKVKGFYSKINQAVKLAVVDHDAPEGWEYPSSGSYTEMKNFLNTYFTPYIHLTACRSYPLSYVAGAVACAMNDGGGILIGSVDGLDIYYVTDFNWLIKAKEQGKDFRKDIRRSFAFSMQKIVNDGTMGTSKNQSVAAYNKNFVYPYQMNWKGTREDLLNSTKYGCNRNATYPSYCAKLIQDSGWDVPNDYPW